MKKHEESIELEFNLIVQRAGLSIPADRKNGMLEAYMDLRRMTGLIRLPRPVANEPSNTFSLSSFMRGS